jgi:hypothetical protein
MQTLILQCTLAALAGLPAGYYLAWCLDEANRMLDAYLDGSVLVYYTFAEVMR